MNICQVENCNNPYSHVTFGHKCEKCFSEGKNVYGHGVAECNNINLIILLQKHNNILPEELECKVGGCKYKSYHTTEYHFCKLCNKKYHSSSTCKLKNPIHNIKCPICRETNIINYVKIIDTDEKCCICMDKLVNINLPKCNHNCLCYDCFDIILFDNIYSENNLKNLNYDIEIIKFLLKPYPSYIIISTKCKITLIRRYNNDSKIEGIILYKDNLYENKSKYLNFIKGYVSIDECTNDKK
jgi:hypothetical protein